MTWGSQNTEDEAHEQLSYAFDYGINFMDTAEMCVCLLPPRSLPRSRGRHHASRLIARSTYYRLMFNAASLITQVSRPAVCRQAGPHRPLHRHLAQVTKEAGHRARHKGLRLQRQEHVSALCRS